MEDNHGNGDNITNIEEKEQQQSATETITVENNQNEEINKKEDIEQEQQLQQQQQNSNESNDNNSSEGKGQFKLSVDSEVLVKGINIDETLNKKQKEREERLASMMSHYTKKYNSDSPALEQQGTLENDTLGIIDDDDEDLLSAAARQRRAANNSRKKDLLAEQMKKYQEQYQSILSDVNSILSTTPTSLSSGSSSPIYSPMANGSGYTGSMNFDNTSPTSSSPTNSRLFSNNITTSSNNDSTNIESGELFSQVPILPKGKKKKNKQQALQDNNLDQSSATTTTDPKPTTNSNSSNENEIQKQLSPEQKHIQQMLMQQQILFFEKEAIPYLSNVGFNTLKSIEMDSIRCAESVVTLTRNLNYSLLVMSRMSVELFNNLKMSNDMTCFTVGNGIHSTEQLIKKCTELNDQAKTIAQLHQKIRQIRDSVDKLDTFIHTIVKQIEK